MRYFSYAFALSLILVSSCSKLDEEIDPNQFTPSGRDAILLRDVNVVSYTPKSVILDIDMNLVGYYQETCLGDGQTGDFVKDYGAQLPLSAISGTFTSFTMQTLSRTITAPTATNANYATVIMMDNSRRFEISELLYNPVFEAMNFYYENRTDKNNVAFGAFAKAGRLSDEVSIFTDFPYDWEKFAFHALDVTQDAAGINNLYDAVNQAIDFADSKAPGNSKSITVINNSTASMSDGQFDLLVAKARAKNVRVNVIDLMFFDPDQYFYPFHLAQETGGFYSYTPSTNDVNFSRYNTIMLNLDDILKNNYYNYRVRIQINYTGPAPDYFEEGVTYWFSNLIYHQIAEPTLCYKALPQEFAQTRFYYEFSL